MNEIKKQTVLELSSVEKAWVFLVPPLLGLVIGWFLPVIAFCRFAICVFMTCSFLR